MTERASLSDLTYDPLTGLAVGEYLFRLSVPLTCFPAGCGRVEDGVAMVPAPGEALRFLIASGFPIASVWRVDNLSTPVVPIEYVHAPTEEPDDLPEVPDHDLASVDSEPEDEEIEEPEEPVVAAAPPPSDEPLAAPVTKKRGSKSA